MARDEHGSIDKSGPANIKPASWSQLVPNPSPNSLFPINSDWKEKKMSYRQKERKGYKLKEN